MTEKPKCKHIKDNEEKCKAYTLSDSEYCLAHDNRKEIVEIRKNAAKLAGMSQKIIFPSNTEVLTKLPVVTKPINIKKARDIKKAIVRTLQETRFGNIEVDTARTLLYGFNVLINCIDKIEILQRIEHLEKIVREKVDDKYGRKT